MSHEIRLKRAYCSNFMSYGNNVNEFEFSEDGTITWIKGPNGVGKSVTIEILSFTWFGTPYRKIKKNSGVRNTSNQSSSAATITGVEFDKVIGDVVEQYEIKRRMTKGGATTLSIFKDGVEIPKAAGMTQKKLEDEILGFDYIIFENIISLNTIQTIPIIDMPPDKKRKLLESIATIHLDKLKKANKEKLKDVQIKFRSATNDVEQYTKDTEELESISKKLEEEKEAGIKDLEGQLTSLKNQFDKYEEQQKQLETDRDKAKERGVNKKTELDKYNGVSDKINNYKTIITHLEFLSPLPEKIEKKETEYKGLKVVFGQAEEFYSNTKYDIDEYKTVSSELEKLKESSIDYLMRTSQLKNQIETITEDGKALKPGKPCITCGKPSTEQDIEKIKSTYRDKYKKVNAEYKKALALDRTNTEKVEEFTAKKEVLDKKKEASTAAKAKYDIADAAAVRVKEEIDGMVSDKETKEVQIKKLFTSNGDDKALSTEEVNKNIKALECQLEIRAGLETDLNEIRIEATQKIEAIKGVRVNITNTTEQITLLQEKIDVKNAKDLDDACAQTAKKLTNTKEDLKRSHGRVTKYSDEVAKCKYIEEMFDDNGIKQIILHAFVPNLNKAIAHNLSLFELPFSVEFNDAMEFDFTGNLGMAQEYGGLSQGQTRKLNFAITIAFRDFVATIADFKINILFLDEVLDISTDDESLEHMLQLLKAKVAEVGQIYLMTHRGQYFKDYFDHIVEIEHDGRYSTINKIK